LSGVGPPTPGGRPAGPFAGSASVPVAASAPASGLLHHIHHLRPPFRLAHGARAGSVPPVLSSAQTLPCRKNAITNAYSASASISARPTISGVKTRSAEFGFRPIDSMAAAVARPCPSAAP